MEARSAASSIKVRLVVTSGNVHPEEVSSFLGVAPSKTWLQGETVHPKATNVHKENGWVLSIEGRSGEWVAERIVDRLIALIPAGRLAALCRQHQGSIEVELSVVAHVSGAEVSPVISLSPAQVAFLAGCGGAFDVDLYLR